MSALPPNPADPHEPTPGQPGAAQTAAPHPPPLKVPEGLTPDYANLVRITHSPSEMVMDFARLLPGDTFAEIQARILMSPLGAKLFLRALAENITRYEASYGEIRLPGDNTLVQQLFRPPNPPRTP